MQAEGNTILSTQPARATDLRNALVVVIASAVIFVLCAPYVKTPLPPVPAFLPAYQSALVIIDLITAVLLFGQFGILRSPALVALAGAYLFSALMATMHALSFPGFFSETGLLDSGPQTTAWLYFLWHGGFPLFVIAYALLKDGRPLPTNPHRSARLAVLGCVGGVISLAAVLTLLATKGHDLLPVIMRGNLDDTAKIVVATATWMLSLAALPVLWWRRPHSVLDIWLMVVMCVWIFEVALASVLNHGRFDLGWYAGRAYGLTAMSLVLFVLLTEHIVLHARAVEAHGRELRAHRDVQKKTAELIAANKDLEAFSYSVSHDLRAPLRSIDGFSRALIEDCGDRLDPVGREHLTRVLNAVRRMSELIDDLLNLSRISRANMQTRAGIDLGLMANTILDTLKKAEPERKVEVVVAHDATAEGDPGLLRVALDNLIGNAWKFTAKRSHARIEFFRTVRHGEPVYGVRDNGAGFDMNNAQRLFAPFQRLHAASEFPGTGIGLATVQRIVQKHGGRIWAEAEKDRGATLYFTLGETDAATAPTSPPKLRVVSSTPVSQAA